MTLLDELAKHTVLDIDSNDVAVAELYGKDFFTVSGRAAAAAAAERVH